MRKFSEYAFASYGDFCKACKNIYIFESLIARISEGVFFNFGMWLPLSGGHPHTKFGAIWIRHPGVTYVQKL